jgi:EAL domain-containing protein (putative c-di-GMP-specific phosphodiesterase class I)
LTAECLGCKVVAEGVEQMEQLEALKELGCHWGQGHLLQPPANLEEIWELLG